MKNRIFPQLQSVFHKILACAKGTCKSTAEKPVLHRFNQAINGNIISDGTSRNPTGCNQKHGASHLECIT